jgi:hypothetical protein
MTNDPYEGLELMHNNYPIILPYSVQQPNSFIPATTLEFRLCRLRPAWVTGSSTCR